MQLFIDFVEKRIKSNALHQGDIHSCVQGTYNKNLLFFNINKKYRYCPRRKRHHQSNIVAIIVNTTICTYSIRCKDEECDNTFSHRQVALSLADENLMKKENKHFKFHL